MTRTLRNQPTNQPSIFLNLFKRDCVQFQFPFCYRRLRVSKLLNSGNRNVKVKGISLKINERWWKEREEREGRKERDEESEEREREKEGKMNERSRGKEGRERREKDGATER